MTQAWLVAPEAKAERVVIARVDRALVAVPDAIADVCDALRLPYKGGYGHHVGRLDPDEVIPMRDLSVRLSGKGQVHLKRVRDSGERRGAVFRQTRGQGLPALRPTRTVYSLFTGEPIVPPPSGDPPPHK